MKKEYYEVKNKIKTKTKNKINKTFLIAIATFILIIIVVYTSGGINSGILKKTRPNYLPEKMFAKIPEMPKDFYQMRVMVEYNKIKDLSRIEPKYWLQPEWMPQETFEKIWVPVLQNPPINRWGGNGYTVHPGDSVATVSKGEDFYLYTYISSGLLIETYQGIHLVNTFPETGTIEMMFKFPDGTGTVTQNPSIAKNYFDVEYEYINPYLDNETKEHWNLLQEDSFVLEPSFPVFSEKWKYLIKIHVTIDPKTPTGKYIIATDISAPSNDFNQEMYWKYKTRYTPGGTISIGRPWHRLFLEVV